MADLSDIDALREKRRETLTERTITFDGRTWKLNSEVPFELAEAYRNDEVRRCFELLLVDPLEVDELLKARPTRRDFLDILAVYRVSEGESSAS